ncbi:nitroreductase family protein, partial [uncultured Adlercreutzia sp.]|uniref:nitroreductase family protein n=1 Tax=uncultured Adlercreutzia sp. TaxID=875803 RepID=UPI0026F3F6E4
MISLQEAMEQRHAVRTFEDRPLDGAAVEHLQAFIDIVNEESWMDFKLVLNEPVAFTSLLARKVGFSHANNYLAVIGPDGKELDNSSGYYGEQIVLRAQQLGINSCWVGQTYKQVQGAYNVDFGESL